MKVRMGGSARQAVTGDRVGGRSQCGQAPSPRPAAARRIGLPHVTAPELAHRSRAREAASGSAPQRDAALMRRALELAARGPAAPTPTRASAASSLDPTVPSSARAATAVRARPHAEVDALAEPASGPAAAPPSSPSSPATTPAAPARAPRRCIDAGRGPRRLRRRRPEPGRRRRRATPARRRASRSRPGCWRTRPRPATAPG